MVGDRWEEISGVRDDQDGYSCLGNRRGPVTIWLADQHTGGTCGANRGVTRGEIKATDCHGDAQTTFTQVLHVLADRLHHRDGFIRLLVRADDVERARACGRAWMFHNVELQRIKKIINQYWAELIKAKKKKKRKLKKECRPPERAEELQVWPSLPLICVLVDSLEPSCGIRRTRAHAHIPPPVVTHLTPSHIVYFQIISKSPDWIDSGATSGKSISGSGWSSFAPGLDQSLTFQTNTTLLALGCENVFLFKFLQPDVSQTLKRRNHDLYWQRTCRDIIPRRWNTDLFERWDHWK